MPSPAPSSSAHAAETAALRALARLVQSTLRPTPRGEPQDGTSPALLSYGALKGVFRETLRRDPIDSLAVIVLGGSYLFYMAEKGNNPKCTSFWDALTFVTTCLSVGYDDLFARTDAGKAIASFVMTFGPALSSAVLDPPALEAASPAPETLEALAVQKAILAKLEAIHEALGASGSAVSTFIPVNG